jgi:tetratricopeptide (TPR) repeat protein
VAYLCRLVLGNAYLELRQFQQANTLYHKCLDIEQQIGDRYSTARTYHALGLLAEAEENYPEARANLHQALEIYLEYQDDYWAAIVREVLERLPK